MIIKNTEVAFLERSLAEAGLPKSDGINYQTPKIIHSLGKAKQSSGHDCFLKGIEVAAVLTADHSFWIQWMRYHFQDIVSSSSKQHTIDVYEPMYDNNVLPCTIENYKKVRDLYNAELISFNQLVLNAPIGMMLTASVRTNYLQLKTTYAQRKSHKMEAWQDYCRWIESLPMFMEITQKCEVSND